MKQYRVVPGPRSISVARGQTGDAFAEFEDMINWHAERGWVYHSMETLTVSEKQGCLSQPNIINYYMLIFERDA